MTPISHSSANAVPKSIFTITVKCLVSRKGDLPRSKKGLRSNFVGSKTHLGIILHPAGDEISRALEDARFHPRYSVASEMSPA